MSVYNLFSNTGPLGRDSVRMMWPVESDDILSHLQALTRKALAERGNPNGVVFNLPNDATLHSLSTSRAILQLVEMDMFLNGNEIHCITIGDMPSEVNVVFMASLVD